LTKKEVYNQKRIDAGDFTIAEITELVRIFQIESNLTSDGMFGPKTKRALGVSGVPNFASPERPKYLVFSPMPKLPDGRAASITSGHWTVNPSRAPGAYKVNGKPYRGHQGVDFLYRYDSRVDLPKRELKGSQYDGNWWVPTNTPALAVAAGEIIRSDDAANGGVVRIKLRDDTHVTYRHLQRRDVSVGDRVSGGDVIGLVGGDPRNRGLWHLHFEVHLAGFYQYTQSVNPEPWLEDSQDVAWPAGFEYIICDD